MDNIQLTLESSTTSLSLNSDSIYLNPEIDGLAGLPEIRTTSGVNAGYNGGWTSAQFYDARLITIRGVISNSDISVVEDRRKALVGLLGQGRKEELTLHFVTAGGNSYVLNCRTISCEMALSGLARKQEFLIQLRADDPLIYDDGALATEAIVNVRRALGGFQIDFGLPLYIGGGVNETLVENGNETVYPVINLYGPLHSPTIINQTTNQQMQVLTDLDYTLTWVNPVEVTGDYILVTNETDKESPLSSVELLGNTTQDTLSGKNLFNVEAIPYVARRAYGSDGSVQSWNDYTGTDEYQPVEPNTEYTLWNDKIGNTTYLCEYDENKTFIQRLVAVRTFTTTATTKYLRWSLSLGKGAGTTPPTQTQLELGSTATSYEPYCGGTPAPNPTYPIAVQTMTGEQMVKMCGKNLIDFSEYNVTWGGARIDVNGTDVVFTPNSSQEMGMSYTTNIEPVNIASGTTLTWSRVFSSGSVWTSGSFTFNLRLTYADGTYSVVELGDTTISNYTTMKSATITTSQDVVSYQLRGLAYSIHGLTAPITFNVQLEYGNSASSFEPYQSQSYEVNLGKNLFDGETVNGWLNSSGVLQSSTSDRTSTNYIAVQPNTTYTLHGTNSTYLKFTQFNGSKTAVSQQTTTSATTLTTTTGASTAYVRIGWGNASSVSNIQLELGSTATTYAPYFTPIELCKLGDYQDYIYKSGDDWFVHKEVGKYIFTGDESPSVNTASTNTTRCLINGCLPEDAPAQPEVTGKGASNYFQYRTVWSGDLVGIYSNSRAIVFRGPKTTIGTTQAAVKTWLASTTPTFYYALATATDTQITNQALIDQLDALASSTLFVGVNNIALVPSGGAQGELSIDYFSAYTEDRDIVVIDSQARTITKNGADIYYLKADGSEFPTLAPGENTLYLTSEQTSDEGYAEIKFKQGYLSI